MPGALGAGRYSPAALDITLAEVARVRTLQSARITALRGRAQLLVGAAGIAGGLISSLSAYPLWLLPLSAFLISAFFGVLSLVPTGAKLADPKTVWIDTEGQPGIQMRANVIAGVVSEYQLEEKRIRWPTVAVQIGSWAFLAAIALIFVVAAIQAAHSPVTPPTEIRIIK